MSVYSDYLDQIEERKKQGLHPADRGRHLVEALIANMTDAASEHREASLDFFVRNTLPGHDQRCRRAGALPEGGRAGPERRRRDHRRLRLRAPVPHEGWPSVEVLIDIALGDDAGAAEKAAEVLKTQVFLYEADTDRLAEAHRGGSALATGILESYAKAEFFTELPPVDEIIQVVTYVTAIGDVSTDLLSPGSDAHSRSDRELHGQCLFEHDQEAQARLTELKAQHPDKRVMLVAEKGTMGVGSSRMSGVNNVALWTGIQASPYVPFINIAPIVGGTNGISPIFYTTVGVTGGIGVDLKNWVKTVDADGEVVFDEDGEPVLEQVFSVDTGTVLTINTKTKKLYNADGSQELPNVSS